jgi:hypothetical protein
MINRNYLSERLDSTDCGGVSSEHFLSAAPGLYPPRDHKTATAVNPTVPSCTAREREWSRTIDDKKLPFDGFVIALSMGADNNIFGSILSFHDSSNAIAGL